jgi:RimJ/RimL family protein N-acetyltransferase
MADTRFIRLSSKRLVLRRVRDADLSTFCRYRSDPEVARFQDWTEFPEEAGRRFFAEQAELHPGVAGAWFQMMIENAETGELIGDCGLKSMGDDPRQVVIGYTLAPIHQGKGYATEAITRLLDYIFTDLGKHRVTAMADTRNTRSVRLMERVGMRREGHFIQNNWFKGAWADEYLYAVLEHDWSSKNAAKSCRWNDPLDSRDQQNRVLRLP